MAIVIPDVTELTPATWDAVGIMAALYGHFNGASTKFTVTDQTGSNPGEDGILLDVVSVNWSFQLNFRRLTTTTIAISCEPTGSLTAPGDTSTPVTGNSADWSDEAIWDVSVPGSGSKMFVIETDEHITCLMTNTTNTLHITGFHIGEIYTPHFGNAEVEGYDGLGVLVGQPRVWTSSGAFWLSTDGPGFVHCGTGHWHPAKALISITENEYDIDATNFGIQPPIPIPISATPDIGFTLYYIGNTKYWRSMYANFSPKTRIENSTDDQAWMWINPTTSDNYAIIWRRGVVP